MKKGICLVKRKMVGIRFCIDCYSPKKIGSLFFQLAVPIL